MAGHADHVTLAVVDVHGQSLAGLPVDNAYIYKPGLGLPGCAAADQSGKHRDENGFHGAVLHGWVSEQLQTLATRRRG
jgi:hypothetical protein